MLVGFLLGNDPNYHFSLMLASVVQGDAVNCNRWLHLKPPNQRNFLQKTQKVDNVLKAK